MQVENTQYLNYFSSHQSCLVYIQLLSAESINRSSFFEVVV